MNFQLVSKYQPTGDQPAAIAATPIQAVPLRNSLLLVSDAPSSVFSVAMVFFLSCIVLCMLCVFIPVCKCYWA